jgi:riboflavin synthase
MWRSDVFTGLVLGMGKITAVKKRSGGAFLSLSAGHGSITADIGDSVAVNGVCLTVVSNDDNTLSFDLSDETLRSTNLGTLKPGDRVNLENALRPDSKIGGHFVTGHVDAVGKIRSKVTIEDMCKFEIEASPQIMQYIVEKGSVAVDGISLTIVDILKNGFSLVIIPHTAKLTTLGFKGPGDTVNIEADILGKYVAKFLHREADKDSQFLKTLTEGGFLNR